MNTPSKRFSAIHIALPFRGAGYIPDGTTDRQAAAFLYEGISAIPPAPVVVKAGGIGKKSKYPKRVSVNGRVFVVRSRAEEIELLRQLQQEADDQAAIAKRLGDEVLAKRIKKAVVKIETRVQAQESRLARLLRDDEEILLLLSA
jgi:hypothetical protein